MQMVQQWCCGCSFGSSRGCERTGAPAAGSLRLALGAFGAYHIVLGVVEIAGPEGAYSLPLGALLLAATRMQSWRVPALAFAAGHWALQAISQLVDIWTADTRWAEVFDLLALTAGGGILAWLLSQAVRAQRWSEGR